MVKSPLRYLALLRGINVGGRNIIAKDDLRQCFADLGFTNVKTYIQSGNVLFRASETNVGRLTMAVEESLSKRFAYDAKAVVLSHRKYNSAIEAAPPAWGRNEHQKHHALFLLRGATTKGVMSQLAAPRTEIETVTTTRGVIFWSFSKSQQTRATLMRLPQSSAYQQVTIRNHNTVYKLMDLLEDL